MFVIIPLAALTLLIFWCRKNLSAPNIPWRESILSGAVLWGLFLVASTEILSLFHALSFGPILFSWLGIGGVTAFLIYRSFPCRANFSSSVNSAFSLKNLSRDELFGLSAILFILLAIAINALLAPPNTWDSMTYHMSRVMHWVQNHTVANYPTHIERQLGYPPFAEYVITHLQILNGSDRFANIVQWLSLLGSILGVSLIAKNLGATRPGQIFAGLLVATLPLGILEASGSKNDIVLSFWLIAMVYFVLQLRPNFPIRVVLLAAAGFGLALLTKGATFLIAPAFLLIPFFRGLYKKRRDWAIFLTSMIVIPLIINSGHILRHRQIKDIVNQDFEKGVLNKTFTPAAFTSNLIRNVGLELGSPSPLLNTLVEQSVLGLHDRLRIDPTDSRTTWGGNPFRFSGLPFHEDHASNVLHILFFIFCLFLFASKKVLRKESRLREYLASVLISCVVFILCVKWQPWGNRFHIPFFILLSPFIAATWQKIFPKGILPISAILFLGALPWVFFNQPRPLLGEGNVFQTPRFVQYFANLPGYRFSYSAAIQAINSQPCTDVGLLFYENSWEYPIWTTFKAQGHIPRIEHVLVQNSTTDFSYPRGPFSPCAIITDSSPEKTKIEYDKRVYVRTRTLAFLAVYQPDDNGALIKKLSFYYLNETLKNTQQLLSVLAKLNDLTALSPQARESLRLLYEKTLAASQQVDRQGLNNFYPEMGNVFEEQLITGLKEIMSGCIEKNKDRILHGQILVDQWFAWLGLHQERIKALPNE